MTRAALAAVLLAFVVASGASAGAADRVRVSFTATDVAAARVAVLRRADLGTAGGWSGGTRKPDLSTTMQCAGYAPKQSDLVVTGAAESDYRHVGLQVQSVAEVLRTRAMVASDWRRTVTDPRAFGCLRTRI